MRHDGWTEERKLRFIERLAETGSVTAALAAVGKYKSAAYLLKRSDVAFGLAWEGALNEASERLLEIAYERAIRGVPQAVRRNGKIVGMNRRYSDRLLIYLLDRRPPTSLLDRPDSRAAAAKLMEDARRQLEEIRAREKGDGDGENEGFFEG